MSGRHGKLIRRLVWTAWWETVVVAVLMAALLRYFVVEPVRVATPSMEPTLLAGDSVLVWRTAYGIPLPFAEAPLASRPPHRGDVVVFRVPGEGGRLSFIKRVVGLPGDRIAIRDGVLSINDQPLTSGATSEGLASEVLEGSTHWVKRLSRDEADFFGPVVVPPDHVFLLGDHRGESEDSRLIGAVPLRHIEGRAFMIWFSLGGPEGERKIRWDRILSSIP